MKSLKPKKTNLDMKKFTNLFVSRAKLFLLAALMGGMTACKDEFEPEMVTQEPTASTETNRNVPDNNTDYTQDSFMRHVSDLSSAQFYSGKYVEFSPYLNGGNVYGLEYKDHGHNTAESWHYGSNYAHSLNRTDGGSTDKTASFGMSDHTFSVTEYDTYHTWRIENVFDDDYTNIFDGISNPVLAQHARDSMTAANASSTCIDNICNAITNNNGTWSSQNGQMKLLSKGEAAGLRFADFGLKQGITPVEKAPGQYETSTYFGGNENKHTAAPSESVRFMGTAYVSLMPTDDYYHPYCRGPITGTGMRVLPTDSMGARYYYGTEADTLYMPFKGWYALTIIRNHANNQIQMEFGGYPVGSSFPKATWGTTWNTSNIVPVVKGKAPNGLDFSSYVSESEDYSVYFSMSEPLFYTESTDTPTGLENVYCGAPRRSPAAYSSTLPDEVAMGFEYKEYTQTVDVIKGIELHIAFAGIRIR